LFIINATTSFEMDVIFWNLSAFDKVQIFSTTDVVYSRFFISANR
jgi:hypothetical protein